MTVGRLPGLPKGSHDQVTWKGGIQQIKTRWSHLCVCVCVCVWKIYIRRKEKSGRIYANLLVVFVLGACCVWFLVSSFCSLAFSLSYKVLQSSLWSNIFAGRIPWTEETGGLQSTGLQRVGHDWSDKNTFRLHIWHHFWGIWERILYCLT